MTGRITRVGDEMVRTALYEAAAVIADARDAVLGAQALGREFAKRRGAKRAKVALARKLGVVLHRIWVDNSTFRWTKAKAEPATAA